MLAKCPLRDDDFKHVPQFLYGDLFRCSCGCVFTWASEFQWKILWQPPMTEFDFELDDGRIAHCWQAQKQEYADCVFSAGLVEGLGADTIYLRLEREAGDDVFTIFLRPDEAQAIAWLLNGTLWSQQMMEKEC